MNSAIHDSQMTPYSNLCDGYPGRWHFLQPTGRMSTDFATFGDGDRLINQPAHHLSNFRPNKINICSHKFGSAPVPQWTYHVAWGKISAGEPPRRKCQSFWGIASSTLLRAFLGSRLEANVWIQCYAAFWKYFQSQALVWCAYDHVFNLNTRCRTIIIGFRLMFLTRPIYIPCPRYVSGILCSGVEYLHSIGARNHVCVSFSTDPKYLGKVAFKVCTPHPCTRRISLARLFPFVPFKPMYLLDKNKDIDLWYKMSEF